MRNELPTRTIREMKSTSLRRERFRAPIFAGKGIEREMGIISRSVEMAARHNEPVFLAELGPGNGPELTINACTHGDETIGLEILATLLQKADIQKGKLRLTIGNTPAIVAGKRFVENDLNRISPGSTDVQDGEKALAPKLLDILNTNNPNGMVIDLHTASVASPAFAIVNRRDEKALKLAEQTGLQRIVLMQSDDFGAQKGGAVTEHVACGIGLELGKHEDGVAFQDGLSAVENVIATLGMNAREITEGNISREYFRITSRAPRNAERTQVVFNDSFKNFNSVAQGEELYSVVDREGYVAERAYATQSFTPILISTLETNPLFLMAKRVRREDLQPASFHLGELRYIKSANDFSSEIQEQLHEAVKSAFGRPDFEREDTLGHLQGDYFQIIYDKDRIVGFSSLELGTPKDLVGVENNQFADIKGGYFAAAVLAGEFQGKGLYSMMNRRRLDAALAEDMSLIFTRTQNPRVEEGITRLLDEAKQLGKIKGYTLTRTPMQGIYGRSLTGYVPHSSVSNIQKNYSTLDYQKGDAYALFFALER